jgi:hypothetical protein
LEFVKDILLKLEEIKSTGLRPIDTVGIIFWIPQCFCPILSHFLFLGWTEFGIMDVGVGFFNFFSISN